MAVEDMIDGIRAASSIDCRSNRRRIAGDAAGLTAPDVTIISYGDALQ